MGYDLRPDDPRRLTLTNEVQSRDDEGILRVTVTYTYDEWCCNGQHEVTNALKIIEEVLEDAQDRRHRAAQEEFARDLGLIAPE